MTPSPRELPPELAEEFENIWMRFDCRCNKECQRLDEAESTFVLKCYQSGIQAGLTLAAESLPGEPKHELSFDQRAQDLIIEGACIYRAEALSRIEAKRGEV